MSSPTDMATLLVDGWMAALHKCKTVQEFDVVFDCLPDAVKPIASAYYRHTVHGGPINFSRLAEECLTDRVVSRYLAAYMLCCLGWDNHAYCNTAGKLLDLTGQADALTRSLRR